MTQTHFDFMVRAATTLFASAALLVFSTACEDYDPPPEVTLVQPDDGAFNPGDELELAFTEPIDPDTLLITIWPDVRNIEEEIPQDADPSIEACSRDRSPCGDLTLQVSEDRLSATLLFDPEGLGASGPPLILDVLPGLEDRDGNATGAHTYRDFQFRGGEVVNTEPVEFQDGVYIVVGSVKEPLPAVLTLVSDVKVLPSGEFKLAGAEGDPIDNDTPNNTDDPRLIEVDKSDLGWTAFINGQIILEEGKRLLETDPVEVNLPLGPVTVRLDDVRLFGEIVKNEEGNDRIEGTLSYSGLVLVNGSRETEYEGGASAVSADFVPDSIAPQGHPVICEDLCGIVTEGLCEPPAEFPGDMFCEEYERPRRAGDQSSR